jgi:GT2 family glycosyltransferase
LIFIEANKLDLTPKVSIIILNWNGWPDTLECLESIYQINYPNYDVILIDNGSDNESIEKITNYVTNKPLKLLICDETNMDTKKVEEEKLAYLPPNMKLRIIINKNNYGFAKGNNIGIRYVMQFLNPKYVLLLNNDTVVDKDFMTELVKVAEINGNVGFLSPKIYFYNFEGNKNTIQYAGAKQNLWLFNPKHIGIFEVDQGKYDHLRKVDYAHGSCLLAKVEMIKDIGMLDADFFSYREENDWGIRGKYKGWESLYVPTSKIWHKGGGCSGGNMNSFAIYYMTRNSFIFMKKHGNLLQLSSFYIYFFIFRFIFLSGLYLVYHKNPKLFFSFLSGVKEGLSWKKTNKI